MNNFQVSIKNGEVAQVNVPVEMTPPGEVIALQTSSRDTVTTGNHDEIGVTSIEGVTIALALSAVATAAVRLNSRSHNSQ